MLKKLDFIISRRSTRKYTCDSVPEELVKELLSAAMNAPSACNQQPWHFVVISDKEVKKKISEIHGGYTQVKSSPVVILVCFEEGLAKLPKFLQQDCSAATENILIAANAIGLGAVWMGLYPDKESIAIVKEALNIPENITPFSLVALGYADEEKKIVSRYNEGRVHYNREW